jgi:hypothetical protein
VPRKKSERGKPVNATGAELKTIRLELTEDVHRMLRKLAADEDMSMAAFARKTVERVVREEFKKRGLK